MRLLSGGNAREDHCGELERKPKLGDSFQSYCWFGCFRCEAIQQLLVKAQEEGAGILLISGDLMSFWKLSNRIVIMFKGEIVGEKEKEHWTEEDRREIGLGDGRRMDISG